MKITLKKENTCNAASFEALSISLFGKPKATVVCGNCTHLFKTRDYFRLDKGTPDECITMQCPSCNKWNIVPNVQFT